MSILHAVILGAVQGLTEFLPVSSSGHLVLLQKIFGISMPTQDSQAALLFDIMLHAGTLLVVLIVLRRDILEILKWPIKPILWLLVIATIPAVIAALVFKKQIEYAFGSGRFLGVCFLVTAALLAFAEIFSRRIYRGGALKKAEEMTALDALVVGLLQAVAIVPGISRSGATISASLSRGLDRSFAARFSFLLSIPAILGALVLQLGDLAVKGTVRETVNSGIGLFAIAAGTVTAAVTGFFAIRYMLKIIGNKTLFGFALYTAVLGLIILLTFI